MVDLDVLARRDVALAQWRVLLDHAREGVELVGGDAAHRELDAGHLDVGLALAVDTLLGPELGELNLPERPRAPAGSQAALNGEGLGGCPTMGAPSGPSGRVRCRVGGSRTGLHHNLPKPNPGLPI